MLKKEKVIYSKKRQGRIVKYEPDPKINKAAVKTENKEKLVIVVDGIEFDADTASINYMSSVVALANYKYNQALSSGLSATDAYAQIYKSIVDWKDAHNIIRSVSIETVAKALEIAMGEVANIIGV